VKLDISLVRNVDTDPIKQTIVRTMIALCRELDTEIVAEGVENAAQRDTLRGLGCELLQGYLFARPGSAFPTIGWPS
jgi:EAL domain-containing protein (putative c-di-GMP-specific phosphodiesterase class I)